VGFHRADAWPVDIEELFMSLIERLKNPEQYYEFTDPKKANAVLMSLCQEAADALATQHEPVAWTVSGKITDWSKDFSAYQTKHYTRPVYTPPAAQRQWVEVEQVKWDGEKFIAKLKEKNNG
jgi:hypothetical protein